MITGLGAVTSAGSNVMETWDALVSGRSGVTVSKDSPEIAAGWVSDLAFDFPLPDRRLRHYLSRSALFGAAAALEALRDADAGNTYPAAERGVALATRETQPGLETLADLLWRRHISDGRELPSPSPLEVVAGYRNTGIAVIERLAGAEGGALSFHASGGGSARAIGEAFTIVQDGETRFMLAGGFDALSTLDLLGFSLLDAPVANDDAGRTLAAGDGETRRAVAPGEGAVILALEDRESALARGAGIYAEIVAHQSLLGDLMTADTETRALSSALSTAGLDIAGIDCIVSDQNVFSAHPADQVSTPLSETADRADPVTMFPGWLTGHMLCASGALNLMVAALAVHHQQLPLDVRAGSEGIDTLDLATPPPIRSAVAGTIGPDGSADIFVLCRHHSPRQKE